MNKLTVLTRAARRRAGIDPPSPLFQKPLKQRPLPGPIDRGTISSIAGKRRDADNGEGGKDYLWVQCDKCLKWRKFPKSSEKRLGSKWYCHKHPQKITCDSPEDRCWDLPRGYIYTYKGLEAGQLVWGKLGQYPPWPAIVSPDPWSPDGYMSQETNGYLYHVEFLCKPRSHAWLPEEMVEPYRDSCSLEGKGSRRKSSKSKGTEKLQLAISEADTLAVLSNSERLKECYYTKEIKDLLDRKADHAVSQKSSSMTHLKQKSIDPTTVEEKSSEVEEKKSSEVTKIPTKAEDIASSFVQSHLMYLLGDGEAANRLQQLLGTLPGAPIPHNPAPTVPLNTPHNKDSEIIAPPPVPASTAPTALVPVPRSASLTSLQSKPACNSKERPSVIAEQPLKQKQTREKKRKKSSIAYGSIAKYFKPTAVALGESNTTDTMNSTTLQRDIEIDEAMDTLLNIENMISTLDQDATDSSHTAKSRVSSPVVHDVETSTAIAATDSTNDATTDEYYNVLTRSAMDELSQIEDMLQSLS